MSVTVTDGPGITAPLLAVKLNCNVITARKWLRIEGIEPIRQKGRVIYFDEAQATEALKKHISGVLRDTTPNIDPETGLTWVQKKVREEGRRLQMENDRAAKLAADEIMLTADHHRIISGFVGRLEQIPSKGQSELGFSPQQVIGLQRMIDDARTASAKEVRDMR